MFRRRKYRRSARTRTRTRSRMYARRFTRRRYRSKTRPEVKITAFNGTCQSSKLTIAGSSTADLYSSQNLNANWLDYITQGTNYDDRIGNTVFIKGIRIRMLTFACSETETIRISNFQLRIIIWSGENTAATNVPGFFAVESRVNFHLPVNRKKIYNVLYDRVHSFQSGGYVNDASAANGTSGASRFFNIWLPLNRRVVYLQGGGPKDDRDKLNFAVLVAAPGMCNTTYDNRQIACSYYSGQIFFTDT